MSTEFQKTKPSRLLCLAILYALMASVLLVRFAYWQLFRRDDVFSNSPVSDVGIAGAWRGTIYDCHGHYLAVPSLVYDVGASPRAVTDTAKVAGLLAPLAGVPEADLLQNLSKKDLSYVSLARGLPMANGQAVKNLKLLGIKLDVRPGRYYPEGPLAATVLGFVNNEQHGYYGLEEHYDSRLRGSDGFKFASQPQVLLDLPIVQEPRAGVDLVLTIDRVVQRAAEQRLREALREYQARSGSIIVMDPHTGAILAMAVAPSYDPNAFDSVQSSEHFVNSAISWQYEPGSVFKLVTMAAALDAGAIHPNDTYYDAGEVQVGGRVFRNWDGKAHGQTTMTEVLGYSLNVGSIYVAQRLDSSRFYEAVKRFGFGEVTGIDLAGEVPGMVREPGAANWYPADLAANSFGQGLAVTPIQMVTAVAALANGGKLMRPYVVERIMEDDQVVWQASPQVVRQVVAPETAATLTDMLVEALPIETPLGVVPHYTSAGKTGTAQIFENGRYDDKAIIASFAGYMPAYEPRFVMLVKLDRPLRQAWGSLAAAPVWRNLAIDICTYLGVPPDEAGAPGQ